MYELCMYVWVWSSRIAENRSELDPRLISCILDREKARQILNNLFLLLNYKLNHLSRNRALQKGIKQIT